VSEGERVRDRESGCERERSTSIELPTGCILHTRVCEDVWGRKCERDRERVRVKKRKKERKSECE